MKQKVVGFLFVAVLALSACTDSSSSKKEPLGETIAVEQLASDLKGKYEEDKTYTGQQRDLDRDESIVIDLEFDPQELGMENYTEIVGIYQDSELKQLLGTGFDRNDDFTEVEITPPKYSIGTISSMDLDEDAYGFNPVDSHLFEKGPNGDWGNLSKLYMAVFVDLETGEKLAKPEVTLLNIQQEISEKPKLLVTINEKGMPEFSWKEIKEAEYYYVMQMDYSEEKGYVGNGFIKGSTEETSWIPENLANIRSYNISEYERRDQVNIEKYGEGSEPIPKESTYQNRYVVIAVCEDGTSAISNTIDIANLSKRVPYMEEVGLSNAEEGSTTVKRYDDLPAYKWITMCDGTLVQKLITYDIEKAKEKTETWASYEKEDMSDLQPYDVDLVVIPYKIDGTGLSGVAKVEEYDKKTVNKDLKTLKERQNRLRNNGGITETEVTIETTSEEEGEADLTVSDDKITANSSLSEYLAINMLAGQTFISLKDFPEAVDQELLVDAWQEAIYQNPLILGARGASLSNDGSFLLVSYDFTSEEMSSKQEEIRKEVKTVVKELITKEMSDLEKEYAINQYLCEIAEYDYDALENAEKNNFVSVDKEFNDSFNPYGVLINKVGVCASYAAAFKLLADEAGLEAIVVTGYLEGTTPHAWNKVKIGDQWHILDSTNNDNEFMTNALLNIPNTPSQKVLVEDDRYVLNEKLEDYKATESDIDLEFYHKENKFYPQSEISAQLTEALKVEGEARLRTDYSLSDVEFAKIGQAVVDSTSNEDMQGFYWLGVIYLAE